MWPQWRGLFGHRNCQKWSGAKVFSTVWFQMSFVPQRHAVFPHLSFQKCCEPEVFWHVFFQICFVPQGREIFDLSSDHMVPCPVPAALASLLFDPPEPQNIEKTYFLRAFFFLLFFSDFFSGSSHLCCFICPYGRKFDFLFFLIVVFNIILSGVSFSAACSPPKNTQTHFARWTPWQSYRKWILMESAGVHPADLAADVPCSGAMCAISIWHWEISKTTIFWRGTNLYT